MSKRLNLNDNVEERFEFSIGGLDYDFYYPTMEEIEPITELSTKRSVEEAKGTPESAEEIAKIDKEMTNLMYSFIKPTNGNTTPIEDTLKKQRFPVVRAFNKMIMEQISAE